MLLLTCAAGLLSEIQLSYMLVPFPFVCGKPLYDMLYFLYIDSFRKKKRKKHVSKNFPPFFELATRCDPKNPFGPDGQAANGAEDANAKPKPVPEGWRVRQ